MKTYPAIVGTLTAVLFGVSSTLHARQTEPSELQYAQFFVGQWNCSHSVGDFSGTYKTTISKTLGDRWLKQTYDFPASESRAAVQGEFFIGYEPRNQHWVRFGAMSDGLYFTMVGKRVGDVWSWGYLLPGTSGNAVYTKKSETEYTVDGPSYPQSGRVVTEHHDCRKS